MQQGRIRVTGEDLADLPAKIEAILNRHVHALAGLCRVGVAGVASYENSWVLFVFLTIVDVVKLVGHPVTDFVDGPPGNVFHINSVWMQDCVGVANDFVQRSLPNGTTIVRVHRTKIHVEANQVATFAWNEQDGAAVMGLDGTFGANIWKICFNQYIHNTPCVVGFVTDGVATDGLTNRGVCAVGANQVLGTNLAGFTLFGSGSNLQGNFDGVLVVLINGLGNKFVAEIWFHPGCRQFSKFREIIQYTGLVDDQVRELRNTGWVIQGARGANNIFWILFIRVPEIHFGEPIGLRNNAFSKAEIIECFNRAGLDTIGLAKL